MRASVMLNETEDQKKVTIHKEALPTHIQSDAIHCFNQS